MFRQITKAKRQSPTVDVHEVGRRGVGAADKAGILAAAAAPCGTACGAAKLCRRLQVPGAAAPGLLPLQEGLLTTARAASALLDLTDRRRLHAGCIWTLCTATSADQTPMQCCHDLLRSMLLHLLSE